MIPWKNHLGKYVCAKKKIARPSFQPSTFNPPENGLCGLARKKTIRIASVTQYAGMTRNARPLMNRLHRCAARSARLAVANGW